MKSSIFALLSLLGGQAALAGEWMPYGPIAIASGETPDRRVADSLNTLISPIRVDQVGYLPGDVEKKVYYVGDATEFEVVLASDSSVVGKGAWTATGQTTASSLKIVAVKDGLNSYPKNVDYTLEGKGPSGSLMKGNLPSGLPEDTPLRLRVGDVYSADFIVSPKIYTYTRNAMLRFFGLQQSKHTKDGAGTIVAGSSAVSGMNSREGALAGGWYDCGDHLKESQTQGYAASVLALMAASHSAKDQDQYDASVSLSANTDGIPDVLAQAKHGADFALAAYDFAEGVIDNMPLSIGDFGSDHSFWGLPAVQELITTTGRGGPLDRDVRLGELGSNISAAFAANLAIVSKLYAPYDATYAQKCLKVAEEMYDFAKSLAQGKTTYGDGKPFVYNKQAAGWSSPAYNGNNEYFDDMALASVALLYATQDNAYLEDAVKSKTLGVSPVQMFDSGAGIFDGGWFVTQDKGFLKNTKNTSWANSYAYALYGLYKLIVETPEKATLYGINEDYRRSLLEDIAYSMIYNLGDMSIGSGTASISLPNKGVMNYKSGVIQYDPIWFAMHTDQTWIYNRYQVGNITEVLMYAEVAKNLESLSPALGEVTDWKAKEMGQLGLDQLHYMMGLNPWDLSFVYGIGDKNDMHPHHRQANPEAVNIPNHPAYPYTVPTGALYGGAAPGSTNDIEPRSASWEDFFLSETCLDASATLFSGVSIVADTSKMTPPMPPPVPTPEPTPEPEGTLASLAGSLNLQASRRGDYIQVEALLPKAQGVSIQVLSLQGSVLMEQSLQGQAGANSWNLKLQGLQGMGVLRLQSGSLEKALLLPRL